MHSGHLKTVCSRQFYHFQAYVTGEPSSGKAPQSKAIHHMAVRKQAKRDTGQAGTSHACRGWFSCCDWNLGVNPKGSVPQFVLDRSIKTLPANGWAEEAGLSVFHRQTPSCEEQFAQWFFNPESCGLVYYCTQLFTITLQRDHIPLDIVMQFSVPLQKRERYLDNNQSIMCDALHSKSHLGRRLQGLKSSRPSWVTQLDSNLIKI